MKKEKHILFESSYKDLTDKEKVLIREGWKKFGKEICVNKNIGGNIEIAKERYASGKTALANLTYEERVAIQLKGSVTKSIEFQVRTGYC